MWEREIVEESTGLVLNLRDLIAMTIFKGRFEAKSFGTKVQTMTQAASRLLACL
jgi:hypothetical protein